MYSELTLANHIKTSVLTLMTLGHDMSEEFVKAKPYFLVTAISSSNCFLFD